MFIANKHECTISVLVETITGYMYFEIDLEYRLAFVFEEDFSM